MPVREPKSIHTTTIQIKGRTSKRMGRLELTTGSLYYYPRNAPKPAIQMTYQQLCELLENEIEYRRLSPAIRLPKGGKCDFWFEAASGGDTIFSEKEVTAFGESPLSKMDSRRVDDGQFSLISQDVDGRKKKNGWYASISLPLAISILNWYIDKWLVGKGPASTSTKDVIITKPDLRRLLQQWLKRLET